VTVNLCAQRHDVGMNNASPRHPFDQALSLTARADGGFDGHTHPAYANMVGPYGGVTCAVLLQAVLQHPQRLGDPVVLTANFAAPIAQGPYTVHPRPARTNRSTQHWVVETVQNGEVVALGTVVTAVRRPTWSRPEARPPADVPPPQDLPALPTQALPPWVSRYDMRSVHNAFPDAFDGEEQPEARSVLWVRDEPPRPLDFAALASLSDCFLPRIFLRRRQRALIGTVSLTTYFHADAAALAAQGEAHLLATARGLNYHDGFFDQSGELWSRQGRLLASTHQLVYYKA